MTNVHVKEVFPGGNTAYGFYSFYNYIIGPEARRLFIFKGGPGTGKSSFMKKIAQEMLNKGLDVELHHCSSDNDSLDGIVIPSIAVALIDGTAPHVVDPIYPGAFDEIINLGQFWDVNGMEAGKKQIIEYSKEIKRLFGKAYKYLASAKNVRDDMKEITSMCMDKAKVNKVKYDLIEGLFGGKEHSGSEGKERHLFISAITPDGLREYTDTIVLPCSRKYVLTGQAGTGTSEILKAVTEEALIRGYDVEVYHCALDPVDVEHVLIPELDTILTISNKYIESTRIIDLNNCIIKHKYVNYRSEVDRDKEYFDLLLKEAIRNIHLAKLNHDDMEKYYVPNMDFKSIDRLKDELLTKILNFVN